MHIVMFSGGAGSWAAARRVVAQHGTDDLVLLFADTMMEDPDLHRFLEQAAAHVGGRLVKITEGRTPWEVFRDVRYLGNTRVDPCSRVLKREPLRSWLEDNCDPATTVVYLGIDWSEAHRFERASPHWLPWICKAPLCDEPFLTKAQVLAAMHGAGIAPPRLYGMGFPHNNCGGFCVKAGQAHFKLLLKALPENYERHELQEEKLRSYLNRDVAILRDRTGGTTTPLTLRELRRRIEDDEPVDVEEWGGCGCFSPDVYVGEQGQLWS